MGLDTSHDCWHGAYSAFSRWRQQVARAAGYMVEKVTWQDIGYPVDTVMLEWHRYEAKNFMGEWDELPSDPLLLLIVHSDCDGEIKAEHTALLANRLEQILPDIEDAPDGGHIGYRGGYKACTERFIKGLREAHAAGEAVDFH